MNAPQAEQILEVIKDLCKIPSVSGHAEEENRCAQYIFDYLKALENEAKGRLSVALVPCEGYSLGRNAVIALLKAKKETRKTVILTGHFDVVDTVSCGDLAELAFDLEGYTEALKKRPLPQEAREDLETGNWLFGRGSMDMKAGLAVFLTSIYQWIKDDDLPINILFWAVPDEEANSAGMIGSLRAFNQLVKKENLKIIAALTGEPCFWTTKTQEEDALRPYYLGSTGKLMPFFYVLGKPAHVGNYFDGLNAAALLGEAVSEAEANLMLFEGKGLDLLAPPACLQMRIKRNSYSVTLPSEGFAYFNVLTASKSVDVIIKAFSMIAARSSAGLRKKLEEARLYAASRGAVCSEVPQINILQYKLLKKMAFAKIKGNIEERLQEFWEGVPAGTDAREAAILECEWFIRMADPPRPAIIVGLLPPFYPPRINRNETSEEQILRRIIQEAVEDAKELSGDGAVRSHEVFGGISDLSFLGFKTLKSQGEVASPNMAGWGRVFSLPTDLDNVEEIPVANMGPAGKDAHQATERLELDYSLRVTPVILSQVVQKLGKN